MGHSLDIISDRFEILLRRYHQFTRGLSARFTSWLAAAPESRRVFSTLESVCVELFPAELSDRWVLAVAITALKHLVLRSRGIELSECGRGLRVLDGEILVPESVDRTGMIPLSSTTLLQALSQNSVLQARVAELECRMLLSSVDAGPPPSLPESPAQAIVFLHERRAAAMDALLALRQTQRKKRKREEEQPKSPPVKDTTKIADEPILPRRALSMAGYWNLGPNDLLQITPALAEAVKHRGGSIVRRNGMTICFSSNEQKLVREAVKDVMSRLFPQYGKKNVI